MAEDENPRPPESPDGRPRTRPGWRWLIAGAVIVAALAGGLVYVATSNDNRTSDSAPCEPGVLWQQRTSPYADGTVIGVQARPEVSIIRGGARIGFPSADEFAAGGFTSYTPIAAADYDAIDLAPRDGMVFRERAFSNGPGRRYFSAGGAVYQVRSRSALLASGIDARPIRIPAHGLDGAPRIPQTGTLLHVAGTRNTWVIDGGARRTTDNVCRNARINELPGDARILGEVPVVGK